MDYEIDLNALNNKKSKLENLKTESENVYNEFNNNLSNLSGTELSGIANKTKNSINRLKKGTNNSNKWFQKYIDELSKLEESLAAFDVSGLTETTEFGGEFIDMFGKVTMPVLKTGGDIHANAQALENGVFGNAGENLLKYSFNGKTFLIPNTKISLDDYAAYIKNNKMYQDAGFLGGDCMLLSQYYASDMIMGKYTKKQVMYDHGGSPAVKMNERCKSTNPSDVLNYCYSEINQGHPVVLQVSQVNSNRGARHLVTMVGYTTDVKGPEDLTPDNILVLDCYDGTVQTLGQARSQGGHERRLFAQGGNYQALGPTEKFLSTVS